VTPLAAALARWIMVGLDEFFRALGLVPLLPDEPMA